MDPFYYTMIGYLKSAHFIAHSMKEQGIAKDLIQYLIIEPELTSIANLKAIAKKESIDLDIIFKLDFFKKNEQINSFFNLGMSVRLKNILLHQKISSIYELADYTKKDALNFRNAGVKTIEELENIMLNNGVHFKV